MSRILLFAFCLSLISCDRTDPYQNIPNVPIDLYVYTTDPLYINLTIVGGWVYVEGGSKGIIVYRNTQDQFGIFERHTPYSPTEDCSVAYVDPGQLLAVDPCSETTYVLTDGTVLSGPGITPLKSYNYEFSNGVLHIFN